MRYRALPLVVTITLLASVNALAQTPTDTSKQSRQAVQASSAEQASAAAHRAAYWRSRLSNEYKGRRLDTYLVNKQKVSGKLTAIADTYFELTDKGMAHRILFADADSIEFSRTFGQRLKAVAVKFVSWPLKGIACVMIPFSFVPSVGDAALGLFDFAERLEDEDRSLKP